MQISEIKVDGYEEVYKATDERSGLVAFIAVHDTTLGPALGGCRMWHYTREEDALTDVLRLSKGMTYKSAVARTGLGGGKSVIVGDPKTQKTPELFRDMGRFVHTLAGRYITAEDVGVNETDLLFLRESTPHVTGLPRHKGGSGNPSPVTAYGVYQGMRACVEKVFDKEGFDGLTIAIQGVGSVGRHLAKRLREDGANLVVTDVSKGRLEAAANELGATVVDPQEIYSVECDVFAPCALGAVLNDRTIPELKCKVVAGAANNQLAEQRHGEDLVRRGILYGPDFVINAGGLINVAAEFLEGGYDEDAAMVRVKAIYQAIKDIIRTAEDQQIPTSEAAVVLAEHILAEGRLKKESEGAEL